MELILIAIKVIVPRSYLIMNEITAIQLISTEKKAHGMCDGYTSLRDTSHVKTCKTCKN